MTDESSRQDGSGDERQRPEWIRETEEALEGVGEALKAAWAASREARVGALESARQAAKHLGEAIEQGMTAARSRAERQDPAAPSGSTTTEEE